MSFKSDASFPERNMDPPEMHHRGDGCFHAYERRLKRELALTMKEGVEVFGWDLVQQMVAELKP